MVLFLVVFSLVYFSVNWYIIRRGRQALAGVSRAAAGIYTAVVAVGALSYISARMFFAASDTIIYDILLWIGSFWFAITLYSILYIHLIDLARLAARRLRPGIFADAAAYRLLKVKLFIAGVLIVAGIVGYGHWNANTIRLKTYAITLPKGDGKLNNLSILFFSDSHFTPVNNGRVADKIVAISNTVKPDLILMAGDVVDDQVNNMRRYGIDKKLAELRAPMGVFTCNGNHEYITKVAPADSFLTNSGVTVLLDSMVTVAGSVQILGRDDSSRYRFTGTHRKSLTELMQQANPRLPVIVLDHQPFTLAQNAETGIALQLSGHTHHGQMFPANLITSIIYELSWGMKQIGNSLFYVTSGAGTWGPPVRIGSDAEVVNLRVTFR